ncbi:hypothetical protein WJX72_003075 [[Myrmecia] bisecta]|uniref:Uncharacterized protein n=1 Tax=[Myrmecia] bisecta TaxID=41462 RepID=A0AAW1Q5T0_9CHLO
MQLFQAALSLRPSDDEARAALYNSACCYVKLKQWQPAADAVVKAVNDHNLKLEVAIKDPDLRQLRERREWLDALEEVQGGLSTRALVGLRSEAKAPFRLTRLILTGGLLAGAGLGLFIITARLVAALKGGEGAPDLTETLKNFTINSGAVAVLGFVLYRDIQGGSRDKQVVEREESLARLQIQLNNDRVVPLAKFRGTRRPVLLAGNRSYVARAMKAAEPFREQLATRGVALVPIYLSEEDPDEQIRALRAEFSGKASGKGFAKTAPKLPESATVSKADQKWELKAYGTDEWIAWVATQLKAAGKAESGNAYIQVQLDGTVRSSGLGIPPWQKFIDDLAELDSVRTKMTDGIGPARW